MTAQQHGAWDDDEDDLDEAPQTEDSSAMRALRKADRAKAKRIAELEERLSKFEQDGRVRSVQAVLQARNLSPKISGLVPADVEPTEEAVGKWLDEYGDVFGIQTPAEGEQEGGTLAQLRQMDSVSEQMQTPSASPDMASRIQAAATREELDALIFGGGAGR